MFRELRQKISWWIAPASTESAERLFYPQQPTCQITHMWHLYSLFLGEREVGTFVEIGANDGKIASNTWGLAKRGWKGWMAEPVPDLAEQCRKNHRQHPNVEIIETAIADSGTREITLHLAGVLTTANNDLRKEYENIRWAKSHIQRKSVKVRCCSLDEFLAENAVPRDFDVLVVDVEGLESSVFSSFDVNYWRPKMIVVELVDTHPDLGSTTHADAALGHRLTEAQYAIAFKDTVNTVFVRADVWHAAFSLGE